jgi:hypothetical protein
MAPPLAGRPPFATDEPDSVYDDSEARTNPRRLRQPSPQNNRPDSTYDVYVLALTLQFKVTNVYSTGTITTSTIPTQIPQVVSLVTEILAWDC